MEYISGLLLTYGDGTFGAPFVFLPSLDTYQRALDFIIRPIDMKHIYKWSKRAENLGLLGFNWVLGDLDRLEV